MSSKSYIDKNKYIKFHKLKNLSLLILTVLSIGILILMRDVPYDAYSQHDTCAVEDFSTESLENLNPSITDSRDIRSLGNITSASYINLSEDDITLIAKLLWFEGRGECDACKRRIVSVVINRAITSGMSIYDVVYATNQFESACNIETSNISEFELNDMKLIVNQVIKDGPTLPKYVTYFRAEHFHTFKNQIPYVSCCNTYVSYDYKLYIDHI